MRQRQLSCAAACFAVQESMVAVPMAPIPAVLPGTGPSWDDVNLPARTGPGGLSRS
jgi:hypothetical protein